MDEATATATPEGAAATPSAVAVAGDTPASPKTASQASTPWSPSLQPPRSSSESATEKQGKRVRTASGAEEAQTVVGGTTSAAVAVDDTAVAAGDDVPHTPSTAQAQASSPNQWVATSSLSCPYQDPHSHCCGSSYSPQMRHGASPSPLLGPTAAGPPAQGLSPPTGSSTRPGVVVDGGGRYPQAERTRSYRSHSRSSSSRPSCH